jgi:hypothetical protein
VIFTGLIDKLLKAALLRSEFHEFDHVVPCLSGRSLRGLLLEIGSKSLGSKKEMPANDEQS